jgi:hypothetical protein
MTVEKRRGEANDVKKEDVLSIERAYGHLEQGRERLM